MANNEPFYSVTLLEDQCELHSVISGFWTVDQFQDYFDDVNGKAASLIEARSPMYALVDFTDFVPQDQATGEAIRDHLLLAHKVGLKRVAILGASPLVRLQYKRLSSGLDVDFFVTKPDALTWLRANR